MIEIQGGYKQWWSATIDNNVFDHKFNHTQVQSLSFQEAADYTAQLIAKHHNNLFVAMSGGLDSSFVAEVFYRNQIPFTPIIGYLESADVTANCDYFHAMFWCEQKNIKPLLINYQVDDSRLIKQYVDMIKKVNTVVDGIVIPLELLSEVNKIGGHLVIGDPMIPRLTEGNNYYDPIGPVFDSPWFAIATELFDSTHKHPGGFFFYTPELLLAMAKELDLTANESVAKTKLFNIPYRTKSYPSFDWISKSSKDKLFYMYNLTDNEIPTKQWLKDELIKELSK